MTDKLNLSRRKVLGALGAAGAGAALGGAGTMAFFSDEETFEQNQLVAGSLDLKIDWEEHYSDWSDDEVEGLQNDVEMRDPDDESYVGFPNPNDPLIWVHEDDIETFMDNTSIEAFPDEDNDGIQDALAIGEECETLGDLGQGENFGTGALDPAGARTNNADTNLGGEGENVPAPLVNLTDVKPGDFGELTMSFHLCDNPGYVWLTGDLVDASENGVTEPEAADPDEDQNQDGSLKDGEDGEPEVELLDEIQTLVWYDEDGDNVYEPGGRGEPVCVQIVLDASGSMSGTRNAQAISAANTLAEQVINADPNNRVGVTFFSGSGFDNTAVVQQSVADAGASDVGTTQGVISGLPANGGSTAIGEGIETADEDLAECPDGTRTVQIVITDGQNNAGTAPSTAADDVTGADADDFTDEIFAVGTGGATTASLQAFARPVDDAHVGFADDPAELNEILAQIAQILVGEEEIFTGTLRELFDELGTQRGNIEGIPLDGNRATEYDELNDSPDDPDRDCFVDSTTNNLGLAWWLPADHGNEIQTDSVTFNLGFYTEQCRHNDGLGIAPEGTGNQNGNDTGNDTGNVSP